MFRIISIIGFIIVFGGIALHYMAFRPKFDDLFGSERRWRFLDGLRILVFLFTLLFLEQKLSLLGVLKKLVYLLVLLCFVVLAVNGFYAAVVLGQSISGYWIMLQTTAGGVFAVCLAILALTWAHSCRFNKTDWPWLQSALQHITRQETTNKEPAAGKSCLGQKMTFWLIVLLALPLILSMVLSMFQLFGTHWQELLLQLHRYSALAFVLVAIVHIYLVIRTKMQE